MRAALLVIDMQRHYVFASEEKTKIVLKVVESVNSAIELFRPQSFVYKVAILL